MDGLFNVISAYIEFLLKQKRLPVIMLETLN